MFLHFSDWSTFLETLDKKSIPHGDKIIKIYACPYNPRELLNRPKLFTVEGQDTPFTEKEVFSYPGRESYPGPKLEARLTEVGLKEDAKRHLRALFRFANSPEIQSCQWMMSAKNPDGSWMFAHPFSEIDGIDTVLRDPRHRPGPLHIDIFSEESLARLRQMVSIDQTDLLVPWGKEVIKLIYPPQAERIG